MASSRLPRTFHRLWAWFASYFWIPCPLCGEFFGGHEISDLYLVPATEDSNGKCVCKDCGVQATLFHRMLFDS